MDVFLAVNLPFSDPEEAIEQLKSYAAPRYLAYRGVALAYRDLRQNSQALDAVNQALQLTPNNPELFYLKAQILVQQGKDQKSLSLFQQAQENFDAALAQANEKFPAELRKALQKERDRNVRRIQEMTAG